MAVRIGSKTGPAGAGMVTQATAGDQAGVGPGADAGAKDASPQDLADELATLRAANAALRREVAMLTSALAELARVSERDTLTPLYNRRYFVTALHRRLARARRHGVTAAVIFVDVDGLKAVNDAHGHAAGDVLLVTLAERLAGAVRANDVVARLGGDEFGVILEHADQAVAEAQAARLTRAISRDPIAFGPVRLPLQLSFGVAMIDPDRDGEDVIARADAAMYAAREREGRAGRRRGGAIGSEGADGAGVTRP